MPSTVATAIATAQAAALDALAGNTQKSDSIANGNTAPATFLDCFGTALTRVSIGAGGGAPTFQNGWSNFSSGTLSAGYYKDVTGRVYLQGCIHSGTVGTVAFTLPSGYRPGSTASFLVVSNNSGTIILGAILIDASGNVTVNAGNNTQIFLDGISFVAVN